MVDLAQCQDYITVAGDGFEVAYQIFIGAAVLFYLMFFAFGFLDRIHFLPSAPTLAELERRHKFLGYLIERKKRKLEKGLKNET